MDRFAEVELFVHVAELGTLSKAAEALGMSLAGASRYLNSLESRLGVTLMQRTARRMVLTEAGVAFFHRGKDLLTQMREADAQIAMAAVNPAGHLRVTAPLSFCVLHIAPMLAAFTASYPLITVDVVAANRRLDLLESDLDVAVQMNHVKPVEGVTTQRLAETRCILTASPDYIERYGQPSRPEQLVHHKLLNHTDAVNSTELSFRKGKAMRRMKIEPLLNANDDQILRVAALSGMGILVQAKYIVLDDIVRGALVPVLDDWDLPRVTLNIAFKTKIYMPAKVRVFIDVLVERFRVNEYEKLWAI